MHSTSWWTSDLNVDWDETYHRKAHEKFLVSPWEKNVKNLIITNLLNVLVDKMLNQVIRWGEAWRMGYVQKNTVSGIFRVRALTLFEANTTDSW